MTAQITGGAAPINPDVVLGYESEREPGSIAHPILGSSSPDATLRPAQMRSGSLTLGFIQATAEADSSAAESNLSAAASFTLTESDRSTVGMRFIVTGPIRRALDPETRAAWTVAFDYTEIAP